MDQWKLNEEKPLRKWKLLLLWFLDRLIYRVSEGLGF